MYKRAVSLWNKEKKSESFTFFREAFKRNDYPEAALLPMPVSDLFKEICVHKGWEVFQRLSIKGELFPLTLIGNQKVVLLAEPTGQAVEILIEAVEIIRKAYEDNKDESRHEEITVIPAVLIFAQEAQFQEWQNIKNINILNAALACGNTISGINNFEDFIEKMGEQESMPEEQLNAIADAVIAVIDKE